MDPHPVNPRAVELIEKMLSPENPEANYYAQNWASDIHPLTNDMSVAADDLFCRHFLAGRFRDALIADSGVILLVQQVRAHALGLSSGVQIDGNMHEPERDRPFPDGSNIETKA